MRLIHGVLVALVVVSFLLWFWPNAVHEPVQVDMQYRQYMVPHSVGCPGAVLEWSGCP